jgi:small subunit ribosomal protein S13
MAEEKQKTEIKQEKKIEEKKIPRSSLISKEVVAGRIVRILQTDIPGNKTVYAGLTRIKGVSWAISNAVCILAKMDKNKKIEALTKEEIAKLEETIKKHNFPKYMLNRRNDFTVGGDSHLIGSEIEMNEELDIKRLKKIRSFRGLRHATGQPTRGQSTRSHFRTNRKKGVGIKTNKPSTAKTKGE